MFYGKQGHGLHREGHIRGGEVQAAPCERASEVSILRNGNLKFTDMSKATQHMEKCRMAKKPHPSQHTIANSLQKARQAQAVPAITADDVRAFFGRTPTYHEDGPASTDDIERFVKSFL